MALRSGRVRMPGPDVRPGPFVCVLPPCQPRVRHPGRHPGYQPHRAEGEPLGAPLAGSQDSLLTLDALDLRPYPVPGGGTGADAYIKLDRFHEIFAADLPTSVTDVMARAQRPLEASVLQEPTHNPAWKTIPSWFLLPTEDRVIGTDAERAMATRAGSHIVEVRASHAVLVSRPTKVTKLIEEAARATATS